MDMNDHFHFPVIQNERSGLWIYDEM